MALDVLHILRRLTINVARQIEIEVVFLDFVDADPARVPGHIELAGEYIDDAVNVLRTQAVLGSVFYIAAAGVYHEYALARRCVLFVHDDYASGNTRAEKEI